MSYPYIDTIRRQLGELGAMAVQTEDLERKLLERAEALLEDVQKKIDAARSYGLTPGAKEAEQYRKLILERARLQEVIAQARQVLAV